VKASPIVPDASIETAEQVGRRHWTLAATIAFGIGAAWRYYWLYYEHPPSNPHNIYADMETYVNHALRLVQPGYKESIVDAINPPGMAYYLALTYLLDPTWQVATAIHFLISLSVPLLIGAIGEELYGWRVARLGVILASLYYPFISLTAYFLADAWFIFLILLSFWLLLRSLCASSSGRTAITAATSGFILGLSAAFKGQALVPGFVIALFLAFVGWSAQWKRMALAQAAVLAGLLIVMIPMSIHQTRVNEGRFCLISTNGPMNFLSGHDPEHTGKYIFDDRKRDICWFIVPPPAFERGETKEERFLFGAYDGDKIMETAWERIRRHKLETLLLSFANVANLFAISGWPDCGNSYRSIMRISQQIFIPTILLPALFFLLKRGRSLFRGDGETLADILMVMPLLGICAMAFITQGETRYRMAFDGFLILLAARCYSGGRISVENVFAARH
jgi:hypothetical protein